LTLLACSKQEQYALLSCSQAEKNIKRQAEKNRT
jgi:hypothetical protein